MKKMIALAGLLVSPNVSANPFVDEPGPLCRIAGSGNNPGFRTLPMAFPDMQGFPHVHADLFAERRRPPDLIRYVTVGEPFIVEMRNYDNYVFGYGDIYSHSMWFLHGSEWEYGKTFAIHGMDEPGDYLLYVGTYDENYWYGTFIDEFDESTQLYRGYCDAKYFRVQRQPTAQLIAEGGDRIFASVNYTYDKSRSKVSATGQTPEITWIISDDSPGGSTYEIYNETFIDFTPTANGIYSVSVSVNDGTFEAKAIEVGLQYTGAK